MITKGIIEELLSPYEARVRIPTRDKAKDSQGATQTQDLSVACICTLPSCYVNLQVGDIVFIGFEDNTTYKAVILGHLCKETSSTHANIILKQLQVTDTAKLPSDTTIGDVSSTQIQFLKNATEDIQKQIDSLKEQQTRILNTLFPSNKENS